MRRVRILLRHGLVPLLLVCSASMAMAHVGSKDVFETVQAGPYILYVTVRPPNVIPGVATVQVRSSGTTISGLKVTPLPVTGEASKHPPAADIMRASDADPLFFSGAVWMMASGTWQVRFDIEGASGVQQATVPVVAVPVSTLKMQRGMGVTLGVLGLFLVVTMAGIVAASVRESRLAPGLPVTPRLRRFGFFATICCLVFMAVVIVGGAHWWNVEAADYAEHIYKPQPLMATLSGDILDLKPGRPKQPGRSAASGNRYLLDHGKVMHLYAIREPEMDAAFHLHPDLTESGIFRAALPEMPPGHYKLYGDVVHASGFPETLLAEVDIPQSLPAVPLAADDARALPAPLSAGELGPNFALPDGYTMVWDRPATLSADTAYTFHFRLLDRAGKPASDVEPYLGMAGHAAFVKTDGTVFAHTHPEGSAAMPDVILANESMGAQGMPAMESAPPGPLPADVGFPYGFPTAGRYRIFIQMKHGTTVETGVFDATVR